MMGNVIPISSLVPARPVLQLGLGTARVQPLDSVGLYVDFGLGRRKWSANHAGNVKRQLSFWARVLPLNTWADFAFMRARAELVVDGLLSGMSVDEGSTDSNKTRKLKLSGTTVRAYGVTLLAWLRWLVEREFLDSENLQELDGFEWPPDSGDDEHRRPFTVDQVRALFWVSAPERKTLYWAAIETGYRASELRRLTVADFDPLTRKIYLDGDRTKNGKAARQVLSERLCARVQAAVDGLPPDAPLLTVPAKTSRSIYQDMAAAKLDGRDRGEGRLDFHSLRGSAAALRFLVGGQLMEVQASMRHADPKLTLRYAGSDAGRQGELSEKVADAIFVEEPERTLWD